MGQPNKNQQTKATTPVKKSGKINEIIHKPYLVITITVGLVVLIALSIFGIKTLSKTPSTSIASSTATVKSEFDSKKNIVVIEMADGGLVKIELYPDQAPITVNNFVKLVNNGFYDGLKFHRVMKGFMIQGGDPKGTGMGGSTETIKGEFKKNGVNNTLSHTRGVISMARSSSMDSASSQFFIMHGDSTQLDGAYAAFGKVIEGMDVVDAIANVKCDMTNTQSPVPLVPQIMKDVRIEAR